MLNSAFSRQNWTNDESKRVRHYSTASTAEAASRIGYLLHTKKPGTIIYIDAINTFMAHMPMVQSGMPGNHFQNQNPNIFRQPQRAKMNAVGVEGNVGKNLKDHLK